MDFLLKTLIEITIFSSIMILVIMALKAIFKDKINQKMVMILWLLTLARLIIPLTISSPLHMETLLSQKEAIIPTSNKTVSEMDTHKFTDGLNNTYPQSNIGEFNQSDEIVDIKNTVTKENKQSLVIKLFNTLKGISIKIYLIAIWTTGIVFILLRNLVLNNKFKLQIKRDMRNADSYLTDILNEIRLELKIDKSIRITQSNYIDIPLVCGIINPTIIIPTNLYASLGDDKLRLIIRHELFHVKRHDVFKNYLWLIAKTLYWFNPLVWIGFNDYLDDIEIACDDMVVKSITKEDSFLYSQSLVDVIKLSKNYRKIPIYLSFCKDKKILRKRVENMLKPTKKLKLAGFISMLIAIIMVVGCFTTACKPTPNKVVVQSKNDGELEKAIVQTAEPTVQNSEQIQPTETAKPKVIVQDTSSNASNTVTVEINAEVINNQPDNIPVAKIAPKSYTQEELMHMIEVFFGNTELYSRDLIKEDWDYYILQKQYQMNNKEELQAYADIRDITDLSVAKKNIQAAIDRFIKSREKAPDERKIVDFDIAMNSDRGFNVLVKTREGFLGNACQSVMTAFNDDNNYYMSRSKSYIKHIDNDNPEFLNAKEMAIKMVADMGIDNVVFGDAYTSKDYTFSKFDEPYWNGREYYVFCFDLIVGNSVMNNSETYFTPPSLIDMSGKDGYEHVPEPQYAKVIPYDRLEVWVEGDRIVQFKHRNPVQVTQIVNDNVAIAVDYPEATELAKQFAYTAYIDPYGFTEEYKLKIDRIELDLVRITEKDTLDDIVVPVWNFCGAYMYKNSEKRGKTRDEDENGRVTRRGIEGMGDVLITINALDGSIIDMSRNCGYESY
jgi:beta-lactamase regulating signal transducer with metallopeptidase domain